MLNFVVTNTACCLTAASGTKEDEMRRPTGHVRERGPGSWEVRYSLGTDPATGKRRRVTASVKGKREAGKKELRRRLRMLDTGEHVDSTHMTVRAWLSKWL